MIFYNLWLPSTPGSTALELFLLSVMRSLWISQRYHFAYHYFNFLAVIFRYSNADANKPTATRLDPQNSKEIHRIQAQQDQGTQTSPLAAQTDPLAAQTNPLATQSNPHSTKKGLQSSQDTAWQLAQRPNCLPTQVAHPFPRNR